MYLFYMCLVFRIVRLRDIRVHVNRCLANLITTTGCFVFCDFLKILYCFPPQPILCLT